MAIIIVQLIGGLAFFLFGMHIMSSGLEKLAGGRLQHMLGNVTRNPFAGVAIGCGVTIAIQSSSAFTVMLVGLVNSGILDLSSTVPMMFGSGIGTTFTGWITALNGIDSGTSNLLALLKPSNFSLIFALLGAVMVLFLKKQQQKDIGSILVGFAIIMTGMTMMSSSMSGLQSDPSFLSLLTAFKNPVIAFLASTLFTAVIQSSAATIGIMQAMVFNGSEMTWSMAIPLILGLNIGTCATALLSSIGVSKDAKRVALIHVTKTVIGAVAFMIVIYGLDAILHFEIMNAPIDAFGIALFHTAFNLINTVLIVAKGWLVGISKKLVKDGANDKKRVFIDTRLLNTPAIAVSECNKYVYNMCLIAKDALLSSIELTKKYDQSEADRILQLEDELDNYEDELGSFLVKLSERSISQSDSRVVSKILHSIGDFERIGDHAVNLIKVADEIVAKNVTFSAEGQKEIDIIEKALVEILDISCDSFINNDAALATRVEPLEQVIDELIDESKLRHVDRLTRGLCTIQHGFVHSDLLANFERVSDHCSNIAVAIIELGKDSFETHGYLHEVKDTDNKTFRQNFNEYLNKYSF